MRSMRYAMMRVATEKLPLYSVMVLFCLAFSRAQASSYPHTDAEFAQLPLYCTIKLKKEHEAEQPAWESRLGRICWLHIHHYCAALNDVNLAMMAKTKKERDHHLEYSMEGGFDYMWRMAGTGCAMMPEVLVNKGKALAMLKKGNEAAAAYQKAIQINQRYIPAYTSLADLYKQTGQTDAAKALLEYALKVDPKSKAATNRLQELGAAKNTTESAKEAKDQAKP